MILTDLPGIYSLSPYTLEEVVARNYLIGERPDAVLNIVDGTNLERNLYLTTQLTELGIPVVIAVNMMDVVRRNGDKINFSRTLPGTGLQGCGNFGAEGRGRYGGGASRYRRGKVSQNSAETPFSGVVEHALAHIEEAAVHHMPAEQQRWYAVKIFERDEKVLEQLQLKPDLLSHIEQDIRAAEEECDDDAESIITNERYGYIASLMESCYRKKRAGMLTTSDKIDRVVTNRWAALPIFAAVMFVVYFYRCPQWAPGPRIGRTTAFSATAGTCSVSARQPMRRRPRRMWSRERSRTPLRAAAEAAELDLRRRRS